MRRSGEGTVERGRGWCDRDNFRRYLLYCALLPNIFLLSLMTMFSHIYVQLPFIQPGAAIQSLGVITAKQPGFVPKSSSPFSPGGSLLCNLMLVVSLWLRFLPLHIYPTHHWDGKALVKAGQGHSRELSKLPTTIWATSEAIWASVHGPWAG